MPKSPVTADLTRTEKNPDYLDQCAGCNNVEILIRRNGERGMNGVNIVSNVLLHNSFDELDRCAQRCQICRVFRQALVLEQVTFDQVKDLQHTPGQVVVRWQERGQDSRNSNANLTVEIGGHGALKGVVNCNVRNDIEHLALGRDASNPAVIEQAKQWLNTCLKSHVGQCDNLKFSNEMPDLVVEILSESDIRLCEKQEGEYVALSYCWGNVQNLSKPEQDEVERGKTVKANLARRKDKFSISELPATVRDAIHIIHAMGLRFAWIDTLCIVQDDPTGVATMHKVYSNALFTLCSCATTRATAQLVDSRAAWSLPTEPCRLGGQWLTTPDMSLNELRLRSPLADRAWTLQEERLSPRMLYISSSRVHWSCAQNHEMEMRPVYGNNAKSSTHRPILASSDRDAQMPLAQEFLLACYAGKRDLHTFWADIVKSFALRSMSNLSDRLTALSGLAAKYLSASPGDEYLAGLWSKHLAEGLAWRVDRTVDGNQNQDWPSWSWATLPLETVIETNARSETSPDFSRLATGAEHSKGGADQAIKHGQEAKTIRLRGRMRPFWDPSSRHVEWSSVSRVVDGEEKFSFAANPEQNVHAVHPETGRVLVYEGRKREVVAQLDFRKYARRAVSSQIEMWAFELGMSTMLILERGEREGTWKRIGAAWKVREDFSAASRVMEIVLE